MIEFRQKQFSEYDAMRSLYVELMKYSDKKKFSIIEPGALPSVLRGNNVVIERFVISTSFAKRDKYRMYIKVGSRAKMPDEVRLPERVYDKKLLNASVNFGNGVYTTNKQDWSGKGPIQEPNISADAKLPFDITVEVKELLGDAIKYDKRDRSLCLEFKDIQDAIKALNILPFGTDYKIYLLNI